MLELIGNSLSTENALSLLPEIVCALLKIFSCNYAWRKNKLQSVTTKFSSKKEVMEVLIHLKERSLPFQQNGGKSQKTLFKVDATREKLTFNTTLL